MKLLPESHLLGPKGGPIALLKAGYKRNQGSSTNTPTRHSIYQVASRRPPRQENLGGRRVNIVQIKNERL